MLEQLKRHFHDPHAVLGLHEGVVRLWRPGARVIHLEVLGQVVEAMKTDPAGLFEAKVGGKLNSLDYRVYHSDGLLAHDPYAFMPTIGPVDEFLFNKGTHYKIYDVLGAHPIVHQGCAGTKFAVWAPSAKQVALVGDFNHWDGRINPMRSMGSSGIWELFIPGLGPGVRYKYEVRSSEGYVRLKSDPYGNYFELRPNNASVVADMKKYRWDDAAWMQKRPERQKLDSPILIYEVHLGSWKRKGHQFLNYRELAKELASYCQEMGFTHVELLPIEEHPLDESWGYQVTGFFAPTSRYGSVEDFQYFVDYLHQHDIGVILDWVPAHFPSDEFSLSYFDGTYLYEHEDPKKGMHPHWNTLIFNYGRNEVSNFLLGSALFWLEEMHLDGLRVDAVASMLYLDYGRKEGEWQPNIYGGNENLDAIEFLKHLNSVVHEKVQGALLFAEESTSYLGVTHPLSSQGLGFDIKWNMGWMNDTLRYFHTDPFFRHYHHSQLTFGMVYAYSEKFLLPLSHDEVAHGKKSLLSKMPGDEWQKFANLRLLLSYQMCQTGKKLLFMGGELGVWEEWSLHQGLPWHITNYPTHHGIQKMVRDMNHLYLLKKEFWEFDFDYRGFEWVDYQDHINSVLSYLRKSSVSCLLCVHQFTPEFFEKYFIKLTNVRKVKEIFNSDSNEYGGSGKLNAAPKVFEREGIEIQLAPLATMIFEVEFYMP